MPTIVLVEDDLPLAELYQTKIELSGHKCLVATDGVKGLELIEQTKPDLVLLDLMLPQMLGEEVLAEMRRSDWGKAIPVVVLTNISESEAPPGLSKLGIERYIVKVNLVHDQLAEIVGQVLAKQKTR